MLGVSPGATPEETKLAYFRLAQQYHPDAQAGEDGGAAPDAANRFTEVHPLCRPPTPPPGELPC